MISSPPYGYIPPNNGTPTPGIQDPNNPNSANYIPNPGPAANQFQNTQQSLGNLPSPQNSMGQAPVNYNTTGDAAIQSAAGSAGAYQQNPNNPSNPTTPKTNAAAQSALQTAQSAANNLGKSSSSNQDDAIFNAIFNAAPVIPRSGFGASSAPPITVNSPQTITSDRAAKMHIRTANKTIQNFLNDLYKVR